MPGIQREVDVVGVGLNATDTVVHLREYPARGAKVEYENATIMAGGQVASAIAACQSWGLTSRYVGKLGDDEAARLHKSEFAKLGVDAQIVYADQGNSPRSLVLVDADGERTVMCQRDPRLRLMPSELQREWIASSRLLHIDGFDTEAAIQAARWARDAGIPVMADLDDIYDGMDELLGLVDYLIVSRDFPEKVTGTHVLERALQDLHRQYNNKITAATLGPGGVLAWNGSEFFARGAFRVPVVDSTGAGDIFHAGMIFGLLREWSLQRTLDYSCAAAAINCMHHGARGGIRSVSEIERLMECGERYEAPNPAGASISSAI